MHDERVSRCGRRRSAARLLEFNVLAREFAVRAAQWQVRGRVVCVAVAFLRIEWPQRAATGGQFVVGARAVPVISDAAESNPRSCNSHSSTSRYVMIQPGACSNAQRRRASPSDEFSIAILKSTSYLYSDQCSQGAPMARAVRPTGDSPTSKPPSQTWRLEQAKARFSEVVRLARETGPQHVTVHGREAVVVLSVEDFARLSPAGAAPSLAVLFGTGLFTRLDDFEKGLVREQAPVRDVVEF